MFSKSVQKLPVSFRVRAEASPAGTAIAGPWHAGRALRCPPGAGAACQRRAGQDEGGGSRGGPASRRPQAGRGV